MKLFENEIIMYADDGVIYSDTLSIEEIIEKLKSADIAGAKVN